MIARYLESKLLSGSVFGVNCTVQTLNLVKLRMYTGICPGSAGRGDHEREDHCPLPVEALTVHQRARMSYEIEIDITSLKGYKDELSEAVQQKWHIKQVENKVDLLLDLSTTLIPAVIDRGLLYDEHACKMIANIAEFLVSPSSKFSVRSGRTQNLYLAGSKGRKGLSTTAITARGITHAIS